MVLPDVILSDDLPPELSFQEMKTKYADVLQQLHAIFPGVKDPVLCLTIAAHHHRAEQSEQLLLQHVTNDLLELHTYKNLTNAFNSKRRKKYQRTRLQSHDHSNTQQNKVRPSGPSYDSNISHNDTIVLDNTPEKNETQSETVADPLSSTLKNDLVTSESKMNIEQQVEDIKPSALQANMPTGSVACAGENVTNTTESHDPHTFVLDQLVKSQGDIAPTMQNVEHNSLDVIQREPTTATPFPQKDASIAGILFHQDDPHHIAIDRIPLPQENLEETKILLPRESLSVVGIHLPREATGENQSVYHPGQISVGQSDCITVAQNINDQVNVEQPPMPQNTSVTSQEQNRVEKEQVSLKEQHVATVLQLFSDAQIDYVREQVNSLIDNPDCINIICNYMLENKYPKVEKVKPKPKKNDADEAEDSRTATKTFQYYQEELGRKTSYLYRQQALVLLKKEFPQLSVRDIAWVFTHFNWKYAPTKCFLAKLIQEHCSEKKPSYIPFIFSVSLGAHPPKTFKTLKSRRPTRNLFLPKAVMDEELADEVDVVNNQDNFKPDENQAAAVNNELGKEAPVDETLIECGCCYDEVAFEKMVQCYEGHLFCEECLRRYANEAVFGEAKLALDCMSDGCDGSFPLSQLRKALPQKLIARYEEKQKEESLNIANLPGLVRCPHCAFAALLPEEDKVFRCQNQECLRETCRYCKEDWEEHFGKRCEEIEKRDEVSIRQKYEEQMTEAKIRTCWKCKVKFTKSEGCNKMTCSCGAKMCYICRQPKIDYNHFCRHARDPGKECNQCKACSLWTNSEEDDEQAIREIRETAEKERLDKGYTDKRLIGAPEEAIPQKKHKPNRHQLDLPGRHHIGNLYFDHHADRLMMPPPAHLPMMHVMDVHLPPPPPPPLHQPRVLNPVVGRPPPFIPRPLDPHNPHHF